MVLQQQSSKKSLGLTKSKSSSDQSSKNEDKKKEPPPFANKSAKLGDTKQWNGKTYYYCTANHKHSHWYIHKVKDCNTYKKMMKNKESKNSDSYCSSSNQVSVDTEKLKKGMAAILLLGDFNTDDLAKALATAMHSIE